MQFKARVRDTPTLLPMCRLIAHSLRPLRGGAQDCVFTIAAQMLIYTLSLLSKNGLLNYFLRSLHISPRTIRLRDIVQVMKRSRGKATLRCGPATVLQSRAARGTLTNSQLSTGHRVQGSRVWGPELSVAAPAAQSRSAAAQDLEG